MKHLRLHPSAIRTFCNQPVNAHPSNIESLTVEDPLKADCVPCLGHAVAFHELHVMYAASRLKTLAGQDSSEQRAAVRAAHNDATWPDGWLRPDEKTKP